MNRLLFLAVGLFIVSSVFSQRQLKFNDNSQIGDTYSDTLNRYALVVVTIPNNIPSPKFYTTSADMKISPQQVKNDGENAKYYLILEAAGQLKPRPRQLTVEVNRYDPLTIPLNLKPNMQYSFFVSDPEFNVVNCWQLRKDGDYEFGKCNYEGAKARFNDMKNTCKDVFSDSIFYINQKIKDIDSILLWKNIMNEADKRRDYQKVFEMCYHILSLNIEDKNVRQRMYDVKFIIEEEKKHCQTDFEIAEAYRKEKDYEKATETYQKIIDSHCDDSPLAVKKLYALDGYKYLPQVLTYECEVSQLNTFIGFSAGKYMSDKKVRGYFTLRLAPSLFEMIGKNVSEGKKPEFDASFGLTKKIYRPVWCFFGVGYTGVVKTSDEINEKDGKIKQKYQLLHAASPEIGILLKVPFSKKIGMAVRYTFQYRFAIKKEDIDYIGRMNHVVGLGFCF